MKLHELIVKVAETGLQSQSSDGSMIPGRNGPYNDIETPVRNTSHWAITFVKAFQLTSEEKFKKAALACTGYLSGQKARPYGKTFWHRKSDSKDKCNGLIGQAWSIEAIAIASNTFNIPELTDLATEIFDLHPFDTKRKLWHRVETDGEILTIDETFNHQLWFAAASSIIKGENDEDIHDIIKLFIGGIKENINQYGSGLIGQSIKTKKRPPYDKNPIMFLKKSMAKIIEFKRKRDWILYKSIGYHAFNLYGLSMLKNNIECSNIWPENIVSKALEYAKSSDFANQLEGNEFGFPYNPPGFELPFALIKLDKSTNTETFTNVVSKQLSMCFDFDNYSMDINTKDPVTHAARFYEATRLPNLSVTKQI
mgnify:FL=1